jgi:hypothetical protein
VSVTLPDPVVSPNYPAQWLTSDRKTDNPEFWKTLFFDSKATRAQEKTALEGGLKVANERIESCGAALP